MSNSLKFFFLIELATTLLIIDLLKLVHEDIAGIIIGLQYITQRSQDDIIELSKFN